MIHSFKDAVFDDGKVLVICTCGTMFIPAAYKLHVEEQLSDLVSAAKAVQSSSQESNRQLRPDLYYASLDWLDSALRDTVDRGLEEHVCSTTAIKFAGYCPGCKRGL